jgi:hypothetical protein
MNFNNSDISVVISTYNQCGFLPVALESLLQQEYFEVQYEVPQKQDSRVSGGAA